MPPRLKARLGVDDSDDLTLFLHSTGASWRDEVLTLASDRFGQVLAAEIGKLRIDLHDEVAAVRRELTETRAGMREDMAMLRVEVLRWSFLFWLGQIAAIAGLLSYLR
ncbi:MAG: hypothetical protein WD690_14835 [Vicinamibacterales bacterium]